MGTWEIDDSFIDDIVEDTINREKYKLRKLEEEKKEKKKKSSYSYLMPWEQELVDKGEYEPENFEEEELEEDDYYYEDEY